MVTLEREKFLHGKPYRYMGEFHWPQTRDIFLGYSKEDELLDQLSKLPKPDEVTYLTSALQVVALRELASEVMNGGIRFAIDGDRLGYLRLINSWIATAEETIAAGKRLKRIVARRKKFGVLNKG